MAEDKTGGHIKRICPPKFMKFKPQEYNMQPKKWRKSLKRFGHFQAF